MKFDSHRYWRHFNHLDVFFCVEHATDDNRDTFLVGYYCSQGMTGWWICSDRMRIRVGEAQYNNWNPYKPIGEQK